MSLNARRGAVLALALAAVGCSRLYGIKVRGEAHATLEAACVEAALAADHAARTDHRADWIGWELDGPAGRVRVDLLTSDTVQVEWARLNRPWPAEDCVRMRPYVDALYARVRSSCTALPASPRDLDLPCSE